MSACVRKSALACDTVEVEDALACDTVEVEDALAGRVGSKSAVCEVGRSAVGTIDGETVTAPSDAFRTMAVRGSLRRAGSGCTGVGSVREDTVPGATWM
jgi:hypothetical protein